MFINMTYVLTGQSNTFPIHIC